MMEDRIYSFLGLATKAGRLIAGDETCERAVKLGKVFLVIVSADASDNTKKRFTDKCNYRNVPFRYFGEKEMLGRHTGKSVRSVIALTDKGFAERLQEMIDGCRKEHGGV
jgi:ribosomal protein L7Ae-like RNA K-turn-binding protein